MKVISKSRMPDGTKIQLEDWKSDYPGIIKTLTIGSYPKAKWDSRYKLIQRGKPFRLWLSNNFESDEEVIMLFINLMARYVSLESCDNHYYNGDKDRFYMGLESAPSEEPRDYTCWR